MRVLPCAAFALILSACNGGSSGGDLHVTASGFVPIANCVVDSRNDVVIGGSNAQPGCMNVEMEPEGGTPPTYREIRVEQGGVLRIAGASSTGKSAKVAVRAPVSQELLEPEVDIICIEDGGKIEAGSAQDPITSADPVDVQFVGSPQDTDTDPNSPCKGFSKGIDVTAGGSLLLYGAKGVPSRGDGVSWTTLSRPAGPMTAGAAASTTGPMTLNLTADVKKGEDPWQRGDWIVVATTNYVPFNSEFVQIEDVTEHDVEGCGQTAQGCSTVTLMQPLKYYHFGSEPPSTGTCTDPLYPKYSNKSTQPAFLCDGPSRNYGVDERAEVGLISRDIEFTADTSAPGAEHWGGDIIVHKGFEKVVMQGVRLSKFGKDKIGSYPIHFHLVGDAENKPVIDADSVDHSYNGCVTIHSTSNLTISNLVCARIVGHIFYEELEDQNQENPADDSGLVFNHDLGIGAMSNSFDIYATVDAAGNPVTRQQMIDKFWWKGDYMTNAECGENCIGYDGFNIPDTDNWKQFTHGNCFRYGTNPGEQGLFVLAGAPQADKATACPSGQTYIEPASGFWIQNPGTVLTNDAIAGCQGSGIAFWWVPPTAVRVVGVPGNVPLNVHPLGEVQGDRASGCYAGFFGDNNGVIQSQQMTPHKDGTLGSPMVVATLKDITASYNRFRTVWLRPTWFVVTDGHFADNNRSVTLVTSGGIDGNAPGVWELLDDSVLVGTSRNNVGRWGPCPQTNEYGSNTGWQWGCIDRSHPVSGPVHSGALPEKGYPWPFRNSYGYMIYDGPVRIFHDRFVNFNYDDPNGSGDEFSSELDVADRKALQRWQTTTGKPYEGDAALGWFPSNQSAYPTGTASKQLMWVNTNLRHQIFTDKVNIDTFNDGDKNTAIIDEDGTLAGMTVRLAPNTGTLSEHAISLNNLPFNSTSNAVDECLSRGAQNQQIEGRDTSLMSPVAMGTLEFSSLYPFYNDVKDLNPPLSDYPGARGSHWQDVTFTRDDSVPDGEGGTFRPKMVMQTGRNGNGIWEPKVANRYGYTVRVSRTTAHAAPPQVRQDGKAGLWRWIELGLADVEDPNISPAHPFYIRIGINYTDVNGNHPPSAADFKILRGYKSYTGGTIWTDKTYPNGAPNELLNYWTDWPTCNNIDNIRTDNVPWSGNSYEAGCPGHFGSEAQQLTETSDIDNLMKDGKPVLNEYYYDAATGYLYFNVVQQEANPVGPSPTGSCGNGQDDPSCPDTNEGETYYVCPKDGCVIYSIQVGDLQAGGPTGYTFVPGPSTGQPDPANLAPAPATVNVLLNPTVTPATVIAPVLATDKQGVPYYTAGNGPACPVTQPPQPNSPQ